MEDGINYENADLHTQGWTDATACFIQMWDMWVEIYGGDLAKAGAQMDVFILACKVRMTGGSMTETRTAYSLAAEGSDILNGR
jgi:hypothetical protein